MKNFIFAGIFFFVLSLTNFASAAEIDRVFYLGNPELSYPLIITEKADAASKINQVIRAEIQALTDSVNKEIVEGNFESVTINSDYKIPCNHSNGILSIILTEYINYEGSAHPSTVQRAFTFNTSTGERIFPNESIYSVANITAKLQAYSAKEGIALYPDFQGLKEIPKDFYFDDNMHAHFIFQQYDVAPYAAGIIDLDADAKY